MADHLNTFHLVIASVAQTYFDGAAVSVRLPSAAGEITVLASHEPYVTTLEQGTARVRTVDGQVHDIAIESGVLEVTGERAVVLL